MTMRSISRFCNRRGLTIVELLVALAITAVMSALLISITATVMSTWDKSRGSLTTSNQVKLALDQLAADIEGAVYRDDGGVWLAATILESNNPAATVSDTHLTSVRQWSSLSGTPASFVVKPVSQGAGADPTGFVLDADAIEECRFGRAGVWLRFLSTRADSNSDVYSMSAPAVVSYQLRRRQVLAGTTSSSEILYMLYRSSVRAGRSSGGRAGTFQVGYDLTESAFNAASNTEADAGNVIRPTIAQVIANNVIDFGVRFYVREGGALRLVFPAKPATLGSAPSVGVASDSSEVVPATELSHRAVAGSVDPNDAYRNRMPDLIEVMVRVLSDEGAQRIQNLEAGRTPGDWWTVALAHSQVFVRRIEIQGKATGAR